MTRLLPLKYLRSNNRSKMESLPPEKANKSLKSFFFLKRESKCSKYFVRYFSFIISGFGILKSVKEISLYGIVYILLKNKLDKH